MLSFPSVILGNPRRRAASTSSSSSGLFSWVSNGDANGICYYIGTNLGTQAWTNPHTAGRLTASRSSNIVGTPTDLVDRVWEYSTTDQNAGEWIKIALGGTRTAVINSYSLQNGSSASGQEIRNWKFQGSLDATSWVDLDVRVGDTNMPSVNQSWGHWAVTPYSTPYPFYRVLMTGVGAGGLNYMQISEIELYGTLFF